MTLHYEMLATAHEADVQRDTTHRRLRTLATRCRRMLLGILPIGGRDREPQAAC